VNRHDRRVVVLGLALFLAAATVLGVIGPVPEAGAESTLPDCPTAPTVAAVDCNVGDDLASGAMTISRQSGVAGAHVRFSHPTLTPTELCAAITLPTSGTAVRRGCSGDPTSPVPAVTWPHVVTTAIPASFSFSGLPSGTLVEWYPTNSGGTHTIALTSSTVHTGTTTTTTSSTTTVPTTTTTVDPIEDYQQLAYESTERLNGRVTVAMGMASIGSLMIFAGVVALALRSRHA
jgi:hypothetical protein